MSIKPIRMPLGPVMLDVSGPALNAEDRHRLRHPRVGGVILFARNYEAPAQLKRLTREIKGLRSPALLVAVDQEGGRVQRFRDGFTRLPPAAAYGEIYDRSPARGLAAAGAGGFVMATELARVGVDISFAPVLDVASETSEVIGDRSLHRTPEGVAILAGALVRGMRRGGLKPVGKHFPGHGGVRGDSHLMLPCDVRAYREVSRCDLLPYRRLAPLLGGVMTAHVLYETVTPELPSYSPFWLRKVLRQRVGFRGLVFSDDLSMAGAGVKADDPAERARRALAAGCDMALVCNDSAAADRILDVLQYRPAPGRAARMRRMRASRPSGQDPRILARARRIVEAVTAK
jgi:beta-N-acetylhexosaminidase